MGNYPPKSRFQQYRCGRDGPLPKYCKYNYHASMNLPAPLAIETTSTHGSERAEEVEMTTDAVHPTERWTAKWRVALGGSIRKGEYNWLKAQAGSVG